MGINRRIGKYPYHDGKDQHRGPDDEGIFVDGNIGLGFRRLSILDLSTAGHQPMFSNDHNYVIVFNGEIFNYLELRAELSAVYDFKTRTDTEVLLAAYQHWGEQCLNKLNGMFSFVILNRRSKEVFVARDRFGIKPFYYYCDTDMFIFASEIKAILPLLKGVKANRPIIYDYLLYNRTDHSNLTFFDGVLKLQHGSKMNITEKGIKFSSWYVLREHLDHNAMSAEEYRDLLVDSLKLRMRSDVPIGVSLSGGLDSSSIASLLITKLGVSDLNTFSAVYGKDEPTDESTYIDEYRHQVTNMHYTSPNAETFFMDYEQFIDAHNEPVPDTGPYAQYKVMELAKKYVTVTLDGQGADEQLGGYHYFFGSYYVELIKKAKLMRLISENIHYLRNHQSLNALRYFMYYLMPPFGQRLVDLSRMQSLSPDFANDMKSGSSLSQMLYNPTSLKDSLLQHFEYKLEHLLRWEDLNSMHFSIEARVPFLDYRLVERTLSLPADKIINKGTTKYILREAVKGIVPDRIYRRQDKKGFSSPRDKWFRSKRFQQLIEATIESKRFAELGLFDPATCRKRYKMHLDNKINISKEIWKWINIDVWYAKFINGN